MPTPPPTPPPARRHLSVVGAVIVRDGLVLCAQRGPGAQAGLWEFPGGKVEPGEDPAAALRREIREELDCDVAVGDEVATTTHAYDTVTVTLTTYLCAIEDGHEPRAHEHAALDWRAPEHLQELTWAPADVPAVDLLQSRRPTH